MDPIRGANEDSTVSVPSGDESSDNQSYELCKSLLEEAFQAHKETVERRREMEGYIISQTFNTENWRHSMDGNYACYIRIYPLEKLRLQEFESESRCQELLERLQHTHCCPDQSSTGQENSVNQTLKQSETQMALLRQNRLQSPISHVFPELFIKMIILSNLTINEIGGLRLVCRAWYTFLETRALWREVRTNPMEHLSIHLASKMSGYTLRLIAVNLIGINDQEYMNVFKVLAKSSPTLKEVHLIYPFRSTTIFQHALRFVEKLPNLEGLSLVDLPPGRNISIEETLSPIHLRIASTSLKRFRWKSNFQPLIFNRDLLLIFNSIRSLHISYGSSSPLLSTILGPPNPTFKWLKGLLEQSSSTLEELCLPTTSNEGEESSELREATHDMDSIKKLQKLKSLTLRASNEAWSNWKILSDINFPNLESLDIQSSAKLLLNFQCSTLSRLTFNDTSFKGDEVNLGVIARFPNLQELNLDQDAQSTVRLDQLLDLLTFKPSQPIYCPKLKILRISNQAHPFQIIKSLSIPPFLLSRHICRDSPIIAEKIWKRLAGTQFKLPTYQELEELSHKKLKTILKEMKNLARESKSPESDEVEDWDAGEETQRIERFEMTDCGDIGIFTKKWITDLVGNARFVNSR